MHDIFESKPKTTDNDSELTPELNDNHTTVPTTDEAPATAKRSTDTTTTTASSSSLHDSAVDHDEEDEGEYHHDEEEQQHETTSEAEPMELDDETTQQQQQQVQQGGDSTDAAAAPYHDTTLESSYGVTDETEAAAAMEEGDEDDFGFGNNEQSSSSAAAATAAADSSSGRNGEFHDEEKKMDNSEHTKNNTIGEDGGDDDGNDHGNDEDEHDDNGYMSGDKRKRGSTGSASATEDDDNNKSNNNNKQDGADVMMKKKTPDGKKEGNAGSIKNSNGSRASNATTTTPTAASTAAAAAASTTTGGAASGGAAASSANPPPPVLKGTLSYNADLRRHLIRGMWNYENSNAFPPQRFELIRNLDPDEDVKVLPKDGEFHGSFSLAYFHTTSKGKQKERSKVIPESGVKIKFTPVPGKDREFKVDGRGTNQFGIFNINGTATPSPHEGDPVFNIVLRKRYEPSAPPTTAETAATTSAAAATNVAAADPTVAKKSKKRKLDDAASTGAAAATVDGHNDDDQETGPLPPPSQSFPSLVVCLRGTLSKEQSDDLGITEVVHRIHGMWASGLDILLADPQNVRGLCNRFEYEHKSTVPSSKFPVSGRYSGWFDLSNDDGTRTRINERDVVLKFRKNNAGYHNVEGRGSNAFGKYNISGTLTLDNIITIFRHFLPRKPKTSKAVTLAPPPINAPGAAGRRPSVPTQPEPQLKIEEVEIPVSDDADESLEPIVPPMNGTYSAVSRGVLRLNEDGSHTCQGKWAVTRDHFNSGQTSNFSFRLESHMAAEAAEAAAKAGIEIASPAFPLDSAMYKGSFALKKGASRYQTIIDQQIVMKFRKNAQGSYNVYGKGVNTIGVFNLMGTLIMSGTTGGQVELYRVYPVETLNKAPVTKSAPTTQATPAAATAAAVNSVTKPTTVVVPAASVPSIPAAPTPKAVPTPMVIEPEIKPVAVPMPSAPQTATTILPGMPKQQGLSRRESSRLVKLPSKLEDDDPKAQLARIMEKCTQILRFVREKDVSRGGFFSEPVDPIALGIPTYLDVIHEPMDLGTIHRKMESNEVTEPEDFARLVRLVFENAIKFNIDPTHAVHQAARNLLILFNQKYRDVERLVQNLRKVVKVVDVDDKSLKKVKDEKKKKKPEEIKSPRQRRLEEAHAMVAANRSTMDAIVAAAPAGGGIVSRAEFSALLQMVQQLSSQVVHTHTLVADLFSPVPEEVVSPFASPRAVAASTSSAAVHPTSLAPPPAAAATAAPAVTSVLPAPQPKKKPPKKKPDNPTPTIEEKVASEDTRPLTLQEQELLTETINSLPPEQLPDIIRIIRESATLSGDEEEIDLEIDQLDTTTQRKLLRYVSKFIKPAKRPKQPKSTTKKPRASTPKGTQQSKKGEKTAPAKEQKHTAPPKAKANPEPFFAFGSKGDSDSESEDGEIPNPPPGHTGGKVLTAQAEDSFNLGDAFGDEGDDDEDLGNGGITANWNDLSKPTTKLTSKDGDDDDAWGAAREEAAAAKAREAERKAREEKMKAEAELVKHQRMASAAARNEELQAQKLEKEALEARLKEQQEREAEEARKAAREAARAQVQSVEQTFDLESQRDLMKQYEQNFLEKDLGSASPSSDFGF